MCVRYLEEANEALRVFGILGRPTRHFVCVRYPEEVNEALRVCSES